MFDKCETVGHPGDEIADPPGALGFGLGLRALQPFGRKIAGIVLIAREQIEQDLLGLAHHPHHPRMAVHVLSQERFDLGLFLRDVRRKRDQRLGLSAHVIGGLRLYGLQARCRLHKHR